MLDTNIVSYLAAGNSALEERLLALAATSRVCLSAITEAELLYGHEKKPMKINRRQAVLAYLDEFEVLPWTRPASACYAELRVVNEAAGLTVSGFDLLIAAHAKAEGATLTTRDATLAKLQGVDVQVW